MRLTVTWLATAGGLLLVAGPLAAEAQPTGKIHRVGYLSYDAVPSLPSTSFIQGLHELGYVEGRDFIIEYRAAEGHTDRLPSLANELVRSNVDVIVTQGTAATLAAKQATRTVPIVFGSAGSPVEKGIVASLARPGGNITGLAIHVSPSKALELLKAATPGLSGWSTSTTRPLVIGQELAGTWVELVKVDLRWVPIGPRPFHQRAGDPSPW